MLRNTEAASLISDQLEPAVRSVTRLGTSQQCIARLLGATSLILGDYAKAREHYLVALEVTSQIQFRPEMALTRLQLAELLLEHYPDERAEAMEHLDLAIPEFRDMKMQPPLERALNQRSPRRAYERRLDGDAEARLIALACSSPRHASRLLKRGASNRTRHAEVSKPSRSEDLPQSLDTRNRRMRRPLNAGDLRAFLGYLLPPSSVRSLMAERPS